MEVTARRRSSSAGHLVMETCMPLDIRTAGALLRPDEAFRLIWEYKFPRKPFPGYQPPVPAGRRPIEQFVAEGYVGGPPDWPHIEQLVANGHSNTCLQRYLAAGREACERAHLTQYDLDLVCGILLQGLQNGKTAAWHGRSNDGTWRIFPAWEWRDDAMQRVLNQELERAFSMEPYDFWIGFEEASLRCWLNDKRVAKTPVPVLEEEVRQPGRRQILDDALLIAEVAGMDAAGELQGCKSIAGLARELLRRYRGRDALPQRDTVEKALRRLSKSGSIPRISYKGRRK